MFKLHRGDEVTLLFWLDALRSLLFTHPVVTGFSYGKYSPLIQSLKDLT
jgi:hypothetical protein